ncbi:MAG: hypothetical protein KIH65_005035, partial [Candidatus Uhrbacteria bacterium]|nr:hypothetical protein [Candidatus Uhrbacteria bacterium]
MTSFRSSFLLLGTHAVYALDVFALFMLGMEGIMPGSVTPYLDPLPFVIVAMMASVLHAIFFSDSTSLWARRSFLICAGMIAILSLLLFQDGSGMRIRLALGVGIAMVVLIGAMLDGGEGGR